jgi:hypothetical protein
MRCGQQLWAIISKIFDTQIGESLDSIGRFWLSNKRNTVINMISSAACWSIWKLRNDVYFQRNHWLSTEILLHKVARMAQNWSILCNQDTRAILMEKISELKVQAGMVLWLPK